MVPCCPAGFHIVIQKIQGGSCQQSLPSVLVLLKIKECYNVDGRDNVHMQSISHGDQQTENCIFLVF